MCNNACINFVAETVLPDEVKGKAVLESGGRDVNGSCRAIFTRLGCSAYLSTDLELGVGVDAVCDAVDLVATYGPKSYDVLVSTEVMEHVRDWRAVISNYKRILKPGGVLFITTRSEGFIYHEYPEDHWRYSTVDMAEIFADFDILNLCDDPSEPGVFIKARRPKRFREKDLSKYPLFHIVDGKRRV